MGEKTLVEKVRKPLAAHLDKISRSMNIIDHVFSYEKHRGLANVRMHLWNTPHNGSANVINIITFLASIATP